jgi:hypothetical protein
VLIRQVYLTFYWLRPHSGGKRRDRNPPAGGGALIKSGATGWARCAQEVVPPRGGRLSSVQRESTRIASFVFVFHYVTFT